MCLTFWRIFKHINLRRTKALSFTVKELVEESWIINGISDGLTHSCIFSLCYQSPLWLSRLFLPLLLSCPCFYFILSVRLFKENTIVICCWSRPLTLTCWRSLIIMLIFDHWDFFPQLFPEILGSIHSKLYNFRLILGGM